jgi:hypothetical protein
MGSMPNYLTLEGNIVLGDRGDKESDGESVVFEDDPPQTEEESDDDKSIDADALTKLSQLKPYNLIMSFRHQVHIPL